MSRLFFFLVGFGFMVIGFTYIITYMNLMSMGYAVGDYVHFIFSKIECWFAVIGFLVVSIIIFTKGIEKDDLHI